MNKIYVWYKIQVWYIKIEQENSRRAAKTFTKIAEVKAFLHDFLCPLFNTMNKFFDR